MAHEPGEKSGYGSADFVVLSRIIEKITGKSFPDFLQRQVLDPLGMTDSGFDSAIQMGPMRRSDVVPHRASVYFWDTNRQRTHAFLFTIHAYSAGGIYSSVRDLAKWGAALDKNQILSADSKSTMWTRNKLKDGAATDWGIGWVVRTYQGRRVAGHSGGPALSDVLRFIDDKLTVVVLQNQQKMYPYLAQGIADIYLPLSKVRSFRPIQDPDPSETERLKAMLESLQVRKLDTKLFARGQDELIGDVKDLLGPYAQSLGAMGRFSLISNETTKSGRSCIYAAVYGKKAVNWLFDLDREGRIVGMNCETP
jgi:CubicO group peptidase (beta-lactamase class C family)